MKPYLLDRPRLIARIVRTSSRPLPPLLLALAGAALLFSGPACAERWVQAARGDTATYFVDQDSFRRDGAHLLARVRASFVDLQISPAGFGYFSAVTSRRVDCGRGQMATVETRIYDAGGRLVNTEQHAPPSWSTPQPDTIAESILKGICERTASSAARPPPKAPSPASDGLTLIAEDDDDSWHLVDKTLKFTGKDFVAVVMQVYAEPTRDEVSGKGVKSVGWLVEGDCARSRLRITHKQAFDTNFDSVRELSPSENESQARQYAEGTIAFRLLTKVCASKGYNVVASGPRSSAAGASRDLEPRPSAAPRGNTSGSAFAVTPTGRLLTNNHVVTDCTKLWASTPGAQRTAARVTARDDRNDLALVDTSLRTTSYAEFRSTPIRAGESVVALGFPLKGLLASEVNVSTGTVSALAGIANDSTKLQISAPIQPGNSGGPLLDSTGAVAGIVVEKLDAIAMAKATGTIPEGISFGIKADVALLFLRSAGVEPRIAAQGAQRLDATEIAQLGRPMTYLLECEQSK